jgi:hypothetical protein
LPDDVGHGTIHGATEGGVVAKHPETDLPPALVGPATSAEFNRIRLPLIPINCWRVEDVRFAFDSSFVSFTPQPSLDPTSDPLAKPFSDHDDIRTELNLLATLAASNPGCPFSVFGHADPVGPAINPDEYNKALSGRRATAIYALMIANEELAKATNLWQQIAATENWGSNQRQMMQQATNLSSAASMGELIKKYLQTLCPANLKLGPKDFLAQGADPAGKGDYQGCSSFNPLLLFSQEDQDDYDQGESDQDNALIAERNLANGPNRRVMILMFKKGSKVIPSEWPCPSATGSKAGCVKRFWADGQTRRSQLLPDRSREYAKTKDTFACRFYDRLMRTSPCEKAFWVVRLLKDGPEPLTERKPLANLAYSVAGVDGAQMTVQGTTDAKGVLRIPVIADPVTMQLSIAGLQITLDAGSLEKIQVQDGLSQRLGNMGYFDTSLTEEAGEQRSFAAALTDFQENNNLPNTQGQVDSQTRRSVRKLYSS